MFASPRVNRARENIRRPRHCAGRSPDRAKSQLEHSRPEPFAHGNDRIGLKERRADLISQLGPLSKLVHVAPQNKCDKRQVQFSCELCRGDDIRVHERPENHVERPFPVQLVDASSGGDLYIASGCACIPIRGRFQNVG